MTAHKGGFPGKLCAIGRWLGRFQSLLAPAHVTAYITSKSSLANFLGGPVKFIYILSLMNPLPGGNGAIQKCLHKELCRYGHVIALFSLLVGLAHAKDCICSLDGNV